MKKKILYACTLLFIMLFNVLAGCTFIGTNTEKYYNTVVAKVGDIEITKYQLMNAYQNYGYQYSSVYGKTTEEAYNQLLNEIIDSEILAKYVEENYQTLFGKADLEEYEKSEIWQNVFTYVNDTEYLSYVNNIRKNQGLEEIDTNSQTPEEAGIETTEKYLRTPYEKTIEVYDENGKKYDYLPEDAYMPEYEPYRYEAGSSKISKITNKTTIHDTTLRLDVNDFEFTHHGENNELNDRINALAQKQFRYYLKSLAESNNKPTNSEEQILNDYLNDLYDNYKKSYLTQKFEETYTDNREISLESIVNKYKELIREDNQKYSGNRQAYIEAVQKDASTVYYHPFNDELIYVSHILIKYDFNNTDYNLKDIYKQQLENGQIDEQEYNRLITDNNLGVNCKVYEMVDGVFGDEPISMNAIELYNTISEDINTTSGNANKLDKFLDYAYLYNQDTGMFSSEDLYTIQLDTSITDTMVAEFADLSRELYTTQGIGSIGICYTQYGAHIIYVAGKVENKIVNSASENALSQITVEQLENTYTRLGYNKTLLDVIAELVKIDDYSDYEDQTILTAKKDYKDAGIEIEIFKNKYKDLYED